MRVSLLGCNEEKLNTLWGKLRTSECRSAREHAKLSEQKGLQRYNARGVGSQAKKFINVACGVGTDSALAALKNTLEASGFVAVLAPGPLLAATTGGRRPKPTLMPLAVSSTFANTKSVLTQAYVAANVNPVDPDPDLDLEPGRSPKWSTHSLRRLADTVARRDREKTETTEAEIDIYFGWHERILLKEMQVHYAGMNMRERIKQARITSLM